LLISSEDKKVNIQIIAGELNGTNGRIGTQTSVNAFMIDVEEGGNYDLLVPKDHQSLVYLLNGKVAINETEDLALNKNQMVWFKQDGDGFSLKGFSESKLLFLSGVPINEKITSYGPYVMNNQTEIMEAMLDYQSGKMGFLPNNN
jgi:redox-sensitive bicupin YhaK (pirin superfamily)